MWLVNTVYKLKLFDVRNLINTLFKLSDTTHTITVYDSVKPLNIFLREAVQHSDNNYG